MKLLLTIIFIFTIFPGSSLWAEEGMLVEVKELGFQIHKPADWHFFQDLQQPLEEDNPTLESLLTHYAKTPVAAISKFPPKYDQDINPNIRVTLKPVRSTSHKSIVESKDPVNLLEGIVSSLRSVLQNFKKSGEVQALVISNAHAAFARISYTMRLVAGGQTRGNSDLWLVMPRNDYVFLISGVTREDQSNATREELQAIVETVSIRALER